MCYFLKAFLQLCQFTWLPAFRNLKFNLYVIFLNIYTVVTKGMLGLPLDVGNNREYWAAVDYIQPKCGLVCWQQHFDIFYSNHGSSGKTKDASVGLQWGRDGIGSDELHSVKHFNHDTSNEARNEVVVHTSSKCRAQGLGRQHDHGCSEKCICENRSDSCLCDSRGSEFNSSCQARLHGSACDLPQTYMAGERGTILVGSVFSQDYARTGHVGIPRFLGVAGRWGSKVVLTGDDDCDCGVMLMNLRNLRDSHEQFSQFVVHKRWKQLLNLALRRSRQRQSYIFKIFFNDLFMFFYESNLCFF